MVRESTTPPNKQLKPHALIHDLRRTDGARHAPRCVPLAVAMATVGHASLTEHQGYSIVAREDQVAGLAALEADRQGHPTERKVAPFAER